MRYVLARIDPPRDQTQGDSGVKESDETAYLYELSEDRMRNKVKVFTSKKDALSYLRENNWRPNQIMIIPHPEMIPTPEKGGW